ncbi:hypothetical protein JCM15519_27740 [Fundidesulfovibrio butyratiphilus]
MDKRKLAWAGIGILLAGVLAGSTGTALYIRAAHPLLGKKDKMSAQAIFMERLDSALDLSERQKSAIGPILAQTLDDLRRVKAPCLPEEERVLAEGEARIAAQLEPGQVEKFKALTERFAAKRKGWRTPDK